MSIRLLVAIAGMYAGYLIGVRLSRFVPATKTRLAEITCFIILLLAVQMPPQIFETAWGGLQVLVFGTTMGLFVRMTSRTDSEI